MPEINIPSLSAMLTCNHIIARLHGSILWLNYGFLQFQWIVMMFPKKDGYDCGCPPFFRQTHIYIYIYNCVYIYSQEVYKVTCSFGEASPCKRWLYSYIMIIKPQRSWGCWQVYMPSEEMQRWLTWESGNSCSFCFYPNSFQRFKKKHIYWKMGRWNIWFES